jgi:hypothetical protein
MFSWVMTRIEAKEDELNDVLAMVTLLPLTIVGAPISLERPDFRLVLADGRKIGLEHTRAVDQSVARARGVRERIKAQVLKGLISARVNAHVIFRLQEVTAGWLNSQPKAIAAESAAIVEIARQTLEANSGSEWQSWEALDDDIDYGNGMIDRDPRRARGFHDLRGRGTSYVTAVRVIRSDEPSCGSATTGTGQSTNVIQQAIDAKAESLPVYRETRDDEHWLLVVGSTGTGGSFDIHQAEGEFNSPFDRTLFLERFEGRCIELTTRKRTSRGGEA